MNRRGKLAEIQVNMITKNKDAEDSDSVRENILTNEELIVDTPTAVDVITEKLKELHVFPKLEHRRRHLKQVKLIFISLFSHCLLVRAIYIYCMHTLDMG